MPIDTAPEHDDIVGMGLDRALECWEWWVPDLQQAISGGCRVEGSWQRIPADDPQTHRDLRFRERGIWGRRATLGPFHTRTGREASACGGQRRDADVGGGDG